MAKWLKHTKQISLSFLTKYVISLTRIKQKSIHGNTPYISQHTSLQHSNIQKFGLTLMFEKGLISCNHTPNYLSLKVCHKIFQLYAQSKYKKVNAQEHFNTIDIKIVKCTLITMRTCLA